MNTSEDASKSRKLKTVIVTVVAAIIILFVGIWAISSALGSGKKSYGDNKTTEVAKTEEKKEQTNVPTGNEENSPSTQYNPQPTETTTTTETAPVVNNNMPSTGPTETIFSALMLGVVAYLVVLNINLVKENR